MRRRVAATLALLLLVVASCKREVRTFHAPAAAAAPARGPRALTVHAGPAPDSAQGDWLFAESTRVARLTTTPHPPGYQETAQAVSQGQQLFYLMNCAGCHSDGGGGMGPNLMDARWYYGDRPEQIFDSIVQGRPNGMPSYDGRIAGNQVWALVAYVRSLSGLVSADAASGRWDHMEVRPAPSSMHGGTTFVRATAPPDSADSSRYAP